jgi:hypothetical protein
MNLIRNWDSDSDNGWMILGLIPSGFKTFFLFYKNTGTGYGTHSAAPYSEHQGYNVVRV